MAPSFILRTPEVRERAIERIRMLNLQVPEPWAIFVAPYKRIRTLEQNAKYWAAVGRVCDATGHSRNVIHTYLKKEAWGVELAVVGGKTVEVIRSSAKADRGDFSDLILLAEQLEFDVCNDHGPMGPNA